MADGAETAARVPSGIAVGVAAGRLSSLLGASEEAGTAIGWGEKIGEELSADSGGAVASEESSVGVSVCPEDDGTGAKEVSATGSDAGGIAEFSGTVCVGTVVSTEGGGEAS